MSLREKNMVLISVIMLPIFRIIIQILPVKLYGPLLLGRHMKESEFEKIEKTEKGKIVRELSFIVGRVDGVMPWKNKCFAAAAAAKSILGIYGIKSTLYLGLTKGKDGKLRAHAWLRAGEMDVVGGDGKNYSVVSFFS